jgi:hypothetical protein
MSLTLLNKALDDFEDYVFNQESHNYNLVREYDSKILKLLRDLEAQQINISSYDIRFKKILFRVNLDIF